MSFENKVIANVVSFSILFLNLNTNFFCQCRLAINSDGNEEVGKFRCGCVHFSKHLQHRML